jgi:hypothetical protein
MISIMPSDDDPLLQTVQVKSSAVFGMALQDASRRYGTVFYLTPDRGGKVGAGRV